MTRISTFSCSFLFSLGAMFSLLLALVALTGCTVPPYGVQAAGGQTAATPFDPCNPTFMQKLAQGEFALSGECEKQKAQQQEAQEQAEDQAQAAQQEQQQQQQEAQDKADASAKKVHDTEVAQEVKVDEANPSVALTEYESDMRSADLMMGLAKAATNCGIRTQQWYQIVEAGYFQNAQQEQAKVPLTDAEQIVDGQEEAVASSPPSGVDCTELTTDSNIQSLDSMVAKVEGPSN